jgi:hypothetical protein
MPDLTATRRLATLDELGVPYEVADAGAVAGVQAGPWARLDGPAAAVHWWTGGGEARAYELVAPGSSIPLRGHVAPEPVAAARAAALGPGWRAAEPILDAAGARHSAIWRSAAGGTLLPFDPGALADTLRSERYRERDGGGVRAVARTGYYALRPLMPHALQIALRRGFARVQARTAFPRWPLEPALHDLSDLVLAAVADAAGEPVPYLAPWPDGHTWALVVTHDVETAAGRDGIGRVRAVEEAHGYRSSWNLVPERYEVPDALVDTLWASGNEVGVHGLRHDGHDLDTRRNLDARLPDMRRWARRWRATGFRSPATHRRWEWMPLLGFDYDSSYPDTDPYEPMPGGCCTWLPFFNAGQVELPITLPQDHTLFVILRRDASAWHDKARALRRRGGMALLIVHPDYVLEDGPLASYERFLAAHAGDRTAWKALPREVAAWWRERAATRIEPAGDGWCAVGPAAARAHIAYARPAATSELAVGPVRGARGRARLRAMETDDRRGFS